MRLTVNVPTLEDLPDAITLARIEADITGAECDTLVKLYAALRAAGAESVTITVEGGVL